jgi:hypothetical protein
MAKSPRKQAMFFSPKKWQNQPSKQTTIVVIKMAKSPGKQAMNCSLKKWQNCQVKKQRFAVLKSGKIAR